MMIAVEGGNVQELFEIALPEKMVIFGKTKYVRKMKQKYGL
jgi:hypothetical protein